MFNVSEQATNYIHWTITMKPLRTRPRNTYTVYCMLKKVTVSVPQKEEIYQYRNVIIQCKAV